MNNLGYLRCQCEYCKVHHPSGGEVLAQQVGDKLIIKATRHGREHIIEIDLRKLEIPGYVILKTGLANYRRPDRPKTENSPKSLRVQPSDTVRLAACIPAGCDAVNVPKNKKGVLK